MNIEETDRWTLGEGWCRQYVPSIRGRRQEPGSYIQPDVFLTAPYVQSDKCHQSVKLDIDYHLSTATSVIQPVIRVNFLYTLSSIQYTLLSTLFFQYMSVDM